MATDWRARCFIRRYRYQLGGKTGKVALGRYPAVSLRDAQLRRDELATRVAIGKSPAAEKLGSLTIQREITLQDFAERYYKEVISKESEGSESTVSKTFIRGI
jgi:hypothetical protein